MRKAVFVSLRGSSLQERIRRLVSFPAMCKLLLYSIMTLVMISIASEAAAFAYYNDICGHQWTKQATVLGKKYWWGIASSTDGTRLAAIEYNGYIYTSSDNGTTWTQQTTPGQRGWVSITSSYDGTKIAAVENDNLTDGGIWQGSYNGSTWSWSSNHVTATNYWTAVTSSGDGGQIYAGDYSGHVYSLGSNWSGHSGGAHIYSLATSSDGTNVYTGTVNGWFHYSLDNGTNFTAADGSSSLIPSYGARFWWSIATGSSGGSGDIFAVDGSGGNVIYLILNVLTPTVDTGLSGGNLRSISYDNYYDDANTTRDFIAAADFGASGAGGYIYTTNAKTGAFASGTWTAEDTDNATGSASTTTPRMWSSVVVTNNNGVNGLRIAATEYGGYIWTRTEKHPQYQVNINRGSGTGHGTVYATSSNITWNGDNGTTDTAFACPDYATLIAQPTDVSSAFDGWVGCDSTSGQECAVSMVTAKTVKAVFGLSATDHKMTVTTTGSGTGTVTSSPTGINCGTGGTSCNANFPDNYTVTLTATPDANNILSSWSGCDNATGDNCTVVMSSNKSVVAVFALASSATYTLNVTKSGTGAGTVTANPGTLTWSGNTGTATYFSGTSVVLTATPSYGSTFTGWSGCDNSTGSSCTVAMSAAKSVTATFGGVPVQWFSLSVTKSGSGSGTVTPSSRTITWNGSTGTASYLSGTSVTLTATANSYSTFTSWSGCDSTSNNQCTVVISSDKNITATFTSSVQSYTLSVTKSGTGSGAVTPSTGTITWSGSTGTASYLSGTSVVLTAAAESGSTLTSWSGCDSSSNNQCTVTMSAAKNVTATFTSSNVLNVTKSGTGTGTVTPSSGTISWSGNTGTATYAFGTSVTLTATPASSTVFTSWSGCDSSSSNQCTVTMSAAKNVTAAFTSSAISDYVAVSAAFDAIYSSSSSWFGNSYGNIDTGTSGSTTYYIRWFGNGAALVAWTDGYLYTYYNGQWYGWGIAWKTFGSAVSNINSIYSQYASWFGSKSGSIVTATSGSTVYYLQWFTNGAALVAWTDGYMYTYYNGSSYSLGVSWN